MKELYLLLEEEELAPQQQADNKTCTGDAWTPNTVSGVPTSPGVGGISPCCSCVAWGGCFSQGAWLGGDAPHWHVTPRCGPLPWWHPLSLTPEVGSLSGWDAARAAPTGSHPIWFPPARGSGSLRSPPILRQPNECIKTLADMKVTLKELCTELREERRGASELQQQFTKAKAAWEMERAELKCHIAQVGAPGHPTGWGSSPLAWWGRGAGGLPAPCAKRWLSGRAGRQGGTVGISISSRSGRRVSIATGLARKCDCGAAEDALYSSAGFVWGGQDGTSAQHPSPGQASGSSIRALRFSPGSQHGWGFSTPVDAAGGMYGCGKGRGWREGSLSAGGSSCLQNQSHRSHSPALTVMKVFCSLTPCWQQPTAVHQLHSPERVPAPPRRDFSRQSSAVIPDSLLPPPKESRAAAVAAPQFQVPS